MRCSTSAPKAGSLQGFLRWFEAGGGEIKRDLDQNRRREVRILTVHASKGLQAPIVYLPDTTRVPRDERAAAERARTARRACGCRAPTTPTRQRAPGAARRATARCEEQNRLLYVAMTRAEDRLYVGGWFGAAQTRPRLLVRAHRGRPRRQQPRPRSPRQPAAARPRRAARVRFPRPARATTAGRVTATSWSTPARSTCPSRPSSASRPPPTCRPGRANPRRPSPIRRRRLRPRSHCPTRRCAGPRAFSPLDVGRSATLEARPAPARAAAASAGDCRRRSAGTRRAASSPSRRTVSATRRSPAGATRRWPSPRRPAHAAAVRRKLARRGAVDRHGAHPSRHLHRQRPGRSPGCVRRARC